MGQKSCRQKYLEARKEASRNSANTWRKNNPEKAVANACEWNKKHPEVKRAACASRRARLKNSQGTFGISDIRLLLLKQDKKCANYFCKCSLDKYHIDHIIPIHLGGNNSINNIQLLCPLCNLKKSAKHPIKWQLEQFDALVDSINLQKIKERNLGWLLFQGHLMKASNTTKNLPQTGVKSTKEG